MRHGEISDQRADGVEYSKIQKFARHVLGSMCTHTYSHLSALELAHQMHTKQQANTFF